MKASEARELTQKYKNKELVKLLFPIIEKAANKGDTSITIRKSNTVNEAVVSELRKLGYKVTPHETNNSGDLWRTDEIISYTVDWEELK